MKAQAADSHLGDVADTFVSHAHSGQSVPMEPVVSEFCTDHGMKSDTFTSSRHSSKVRRHEDILSEVILRGENRRYIAGIV